jgi:hypothetical protein
MVSNNKAAPQNLFLVFGLIAVINEPLILGLWNVIRKIITHKHKLKVLHVPLFYMFTITKIAMVCLWDYISQICTSGNYVERITKLYTLFLLASKSKHHKFLSRTYCLKAGRVVSANRFCKCINMKTCFLSAVKNMHWYTKKTFYKNK